MMGHERLCRGLALTVHVLGTLSVSLVVTPDRDRVWFVEDLAAGTLFPSVLFCGDVAGARAFLRHAFGNRDRV